MIKAGLLPLLPLIPISVTFYSRSCGQNSPSWRVSILSAAVLWGVLLTAITEALSVFNAITPAWISGLWGLVTLVSAYICISAVNKAKPVAWSPGLGALSSVILPLSCVIIIAILLGVIALIAPPNTWDSMTYHMSRVMHWIQNRNVGHYPTHIMRQLFLQPWAEFAIMHLQILSGTDRFANLIQWLSMVGSLCGVSLIAKHFKAPPLTQIFAAVVAVTVPMGIIQASSTQNDHVVSFWLVCFVYFIMQLIKEPANLKYSIATGASLGLAFLTKGTAYIYSLPFLAWFACVGLKELKIKALKPFLVIVALVALLNIGHFMRNFEIFHDPLGQTREYANSSAAFSALASNVIRNVGLHFGTPFKRTNIMLQDSVYAIHRYFNIDIYDPHTTFIKKAFIVQLLFSENVTSNFVHLLLIIISMAVFLASYPKREGRGLFNYCMALVCGFMFFCVYLKWQPWHSRLHMPLFILWSPFIAMALASSYRYDSRITKFICLVLILASLPWVFYSQSRKLVGKDNIFTVGRFDQYFWYKNNLKESYIRAVNYVKYRGCPEVGIILGYDDWEYPFFVIFQKRYPQGFRIEHVNVDNISAAKYSVHPFDNFDPGAIIFIGTPSGNEIVYKNVSYIKEWSSKSVNVFVKPALNKAHL